MNADVLYHGTPYPRLILRSGTLLRAECGDEKVCLTRSPEVAAYWALLQRDDHEARGGPIRHARDQDCAADRRRPQQRERGLDFLTFADGAARKGIVTLTGFASKLRQFR